MTAPTVLAQFRDIAPRYDVVLCDVWGVIHNGVESYPEPCEALATFAAQRGPVILISNAARPRDPVAVQLDGLGVPRAAWTELVTSGDATRLVLAEKAPGPVWVIGQASDGPLYDGLGLEFAEPEAATFISVTGPYDDEVEGPEDYRERFIPCAARDLEMVCANPDLVVQRGDRLIYCGGALAQLYETLGGRVTMAGKPYAPIYALAIAEAERRLGRAVDPKRVLCIGDGLPTDVRGANARELDVLFIASGIHGAEAVGPEGVKLDVVEDLLRQAGLQATWAMADLVW